MQIELLETFLDLIETNSFNRTSERLGLTQSTVSSRVKALEAELGQKLFTRSRAGTQPTAAGQRLVDHARTLRREWNEAKRTVKSVGNLTQAMRIGIQTDLAAARIGDWFLEFRQALPETAFYIELDYSTQMSAEVLSGEKDLAILFTPGLAPDLHYEAVGEIAYRLVSTHAKRLCELTPEHYIFANYSPAFDKAHRRLLPDYTGSAIASGQNAAVCGLLSSLGGSAFVLEESAEWLVDSGTCHYVADIEAIQQAVYVAVHVRRRHTHAHRRLLAIVREHFAGAGSGS